MATVKPPWSQYEGVAAMFKLATSKDCSEIPITSQKMQKVLLNCAYKEAPVFVPLPLNCYTILLSKKFIDKKERVRDSMERNLGWMSNLNVFWSLIDQTVVVQKAERTNTSTL
ncbi:PREDICTED: uncharacterized protein LOC109169692 [Ipomoea nil]|uniref:uncharacterized protein LOC109169692 n=1 Tax=Ipomoea nil TaxID=35883 RepID=UPI0009013D90|nr:PREDICTED: uncharacterized protein LOC109169692 [Ipomoea nil]